MHLGLMLMKHSGRQSLAHSTYTLNNTTCLLPWTGARRDSWFLGGSRLNGCSGGSWHCPTEAMDMKMAQPAGNWIQGSFVSDPGVFAQFSTTVW